MLRHAFLDDVVVQGAKLLPDAGLHFTPEAYFPFWLDGWRVHDFVFPPVRIRGRLLEVNWFTRIHFPSSPVADPSLPIGMAFPHRMGTNAVSRHWFLKPGTIEGTFFVT
jgi:hypothetical protein